MDGKDGHPRIFRTPIFLGMYWMYYLMMQLIKVVEA
jgi:hypothetical protein